MNRILILGIVILAGVIFLGAQARWPGGGPKGLAEQVKKAYGGNVLSTLDDANVLSGKFDAVIENTGIDTANPRWHELQFERGSFASFRDMQIWLKQREKTSGVPFWFTGKLSNCRKGLCMFTFPGGIDHNRLYLQKVYYGYKKGRLYVKKISLLNG